MSNANSQRYYTLIWNPDMKDYWETLFKSRIDFKHLHDSGFAQVEPIKCETSPFTEVWKFRAKHENLKETLNLCLNVSPDEKRVISYMGDVLYYFHSWDHDRWGRPSFEEYIDFNGIRAINISHGQKRPAFEDARKFALNLLGLLNLKKDKEIWNEFMKVIGLRKDYHRLQKGEGLEYLFSASYSL
ncbi:MAG: hypothetical protein JW891_13650 [Candidatus Lokiarchaeota archaeon]|nr:hypothetical protein [Candidatus Lokiarchaeota archaeon]